MTTSRLVAVVFMVTVAWLAHGQVARAAIVYPSSGSETVPLNGTVTVDIKLDSQNEVINAVETTLVFDPGVLEVVSVTHADSLLTLWTEEPSNSGPGKVSLSGGRPDGTLAVGGRLASVAFRTLRLGSTSVAVQPALTGVYLHDGYATPAEVTGRSLELDVVTPVDLLTQPQSPSHPIEGVWSRLRDFHLTWTPLKSASVSYRISRDPASMPDEVAEENRGQAIFPGLDDGLWYLTFIERLPGQPWSEVFRREIRIDGTPPLPFDLSFEQDQGAVPYIAFSVQDLESGVARYVARIERSRWWTPWSVQATEMQVPGPFSVTDSVHVAKVTVTAYDAAGNVRSASVNGPGRPDVRWVLLTIIGSIVVLGVILIELLRRPHTKGRKKS